MSTAPGTRRHFLKTAAGALGAVAAGAEAAAGKGFSFAVLNDLHYRDERCGAWLEKVAAHLRAVWPRPAFVVLAGDLADEGTAAQLGAVKEIFRSMPMPVHAIIGNHDYTADGGREAWLNLYGARLNYRFDHGDYQFLALDTTQGRSVYRTRIPRETLAWVERQALALSRDRPVVVLTHFPLGRNWLRPRNAGDLLARLQPFPLQGAFSGHWHGLTERVEKGVPLSTGRCCSWWRTNHDGSSLKGFTLCHASPGGLRHEFVPVPTPIA